MVSSVQRYFSTGAEQSKVLISPNESSQRFRRAGLRCFSLARGKQRESPQSGARTGRRRTENIRHFAQGLAAKVGRELFRLRPPRELKAASGSTCWMFLSFRSWDRCCAARSAAVLLG